MSMTVDKLRELIPVGSLLVVAGHVGKVVSIEPIDHPLYFAQVVLSDPTGPGRTVYCSHASWEGELVFQAGPLVTIGEVVLGDE